MATLDLGKIKQVWRGTYNNSTAYTVDDLVSFTDSGITSTYICVANSTGNAPSSSGTAHASWNYVAKGVVDPIPSQSGNSGKVLKTDGSSVSWGTDLGGKVLQAKHSFNTATITVTHSGTTSDTFGLQGGRVYGDLNTITITPTSSSSTMIIQGLSGMTDAGAGTYSGNGAFGVVAVLDNGTSNNIDNTDYQYYPETGTFGTGYYPPNVVVQGSYASGNTNAQTWRLKGYTYRESGTDVSKFRRSSLLIMEVDI